MTRPRRALAALLVPIAIVFGSQVEGRDLAPAALGPAAPGLQRAALKAVRPAPDTDALRRGDPALRTPPPGPWSGRALTARRIERSRAIPHQLGLGRRGPWISGGRRPLLAPSLATGRLERTAAFAGIPETIRVIGLRIDFETDRLGSETSTPDGRFDLRDGRALGIPIDPPPHNRAYFRSHLGALARYFDFASSGNMVIEYEVYPLADSATYRLGDTGDYGPWTLGQASFDEAQRFFRDAVEKADQTDSIPFGDFDVVTLFHAGADFQTDLLGDSPRDLPTFQINLMDSVLVNGGAVAIFGGVVMPETENQDGYYGALNGTLAHEFGHTQGLPDLYDVNTFFPAVGVWSNMDSGYLLTTLVQDQRTGGIAEVTGVMPTSLDPWSRAQLWPDQLDIVDPGRSLTTSLRASEVSDRLLYVPLGGAEYYLVENREADLNGDNSLYLDRDSTTYVIQGPGLSSADPTDSLGRFEYDFLLPGQGVLVWHVDESVLFGPNIPPDFGVNSNPDRRGVSVVEADGIQDIGDPNSPYFFGGPFDPWFVGNRTRLGPDTSPSTRTHDGAHSHVELTVGSPPGIEMSVSVRSEWRALGWPVVTAFGSSGGPPTYGSLRHDGNRNVVGSADSSIVAWMSDGEPYYTANEDGLFAALPDSIRAPVLFADSLFRSNALAPHGAAVVATTMDGAVHALRPAPRDSTASIPLAGWPPPLGSGVAATTAPVLAPGGSVLVGTSDGRVLSIAPSDSATVPPLVFAVSDTLVVGGLPVIAPVVGNLAVGRFTGTGYLVAYAMRNGIVRLVSPVGKDPSPIDAHWIAGGPNFRPHLLGTDMDRAADRNLEIVVVDPSLGLVHCFDLAGNELPGWPVSVTAGLPGAPAAGDLDGDGYPEIFLVDDTGYVHRWNRNGVEPEGWPVALGVRFGASATGTTGAPVIGDLALGGGSELLVPLQNGLLVAVQEDGRIAPGWPIPSQAGPEISPLLVSLNDARTPPDPPGPAWQHVVAAGGDGLWSAFQLGIRADSAFVTADGTSRRSPWIGFAGDRRRSAVLDDDELAPVAASAPILAAGSFYAYPNPARGPDVGIAYSLGPGVGSVDIRILDPVGNEVRRISGTTAPAENVTRFPVQDLASGVYLLRLEVKRGASSEVVFRKLAVVR